MAVRPQRVAARGRAPRIREALLGDEHERPLGHAAVGDRLLGRGDLGERAADVDGAGAAARLGGPRHRPGEREVELERAGP